MNTEHLCITVFLICIFWLEFETVCLRIFFCSFRLCPGQQIFSLFDYEDYYGSPLLNTQPSNSLIIETKNPSPPIIPLREVKIQNSGLSLFDNEPVSINTVRTTVSQNLNKVQYNCNEIAIKLFSNSYNCTFFPIFLAYCSDQQ